AVDRNGDSQMEVRRDRANALDHRTYARRRIAVGGNRGRVEPAMVVIRPDDLRKVLAQERLAAREQKQPDRRHAGQETLDLLERELVAPLVDRIETVSALRVARRCHE